MPRGLLDRLSQQSLLIERTKALRFELTLPSELLAGSKAEVSRNYKIDDQVQKRHQQFAYELALALAALKRINPEGFDSFIEASQVLNQMTDGKVESYLSGFSTEFILKFAILRKT